MILVKLSSDWFKYRSEKKEYGVYKVNLLRNRNTMYYFIETQGFKQVRLNYKIDIESRWYSRLIHWGRLNGILNCQHELEEVE